MQIPIISCFIGLSSLWGTIFFYWIQQPKLGQFKIQKKQTETKHAFLISIRNQLVSVVILFYAGDSIFSMNSNIFKIIFDSIAIIFVEEVGFYYVHRAMHTPFAFKLIHSMHHEFTAPSVMTATYCHIVEHIVCNIAPVLIGPWLVRPHFVLLWLWIAVASFSAVQSHCGFEIPYLPSPRAHDEHHRIFVINYGVMGWMDKIHGTDEYYQ